MSQRLLIDNVRVRYGEAVALDGVSLDVSAGAVVAVVGPSGCGKSTLLRCIAGLEPLASGRVELGGRDLAGVPTHERDLGLMFQDHALFPHLSVSANVSFGLSMQGRSAAEQRARSEELLDLVGLGGFGDRSVGSLSGGEAQRVALARALAPSPGLLMLDEPLGSLDRVLREQLTADLRRLVRELGITALHVTHDQAEAFALADHIVVLREGRIEQQGPPEALWRSPVNRFVAEFLGHPNLWRFGGAFVLAPITTISVAADGEIIATVEDREFAEGQHRVIGRVDEAPDTDLVGQRIVFRSDVGPAIGDRVGLHLSAPPRALEGMSPGDTSES